MDLNTKQPTEHRKSFTFTRLARIICGSLLIVRACIFIKDSILITILSTPLVISASNIKNFHPFIFILLKVLFFIIFILSLKCSIYIIFKGIKWIFHSFKWKDLIYISLVYILVFLLALGQIFIAMYLSPLLYEKFSEQIEKKLMVEALIGKNTE